MPPRERESRRERKELGRREEATKTKGKNRKEETEALYALKVW